MESVKRYQGYLAAGLGVAVLAGAGAAYARRDLDASAAVIVVALGLALLLIGLLYARISDRVDCLFCYAKVPRLYSEPIHMDGQAHAFCCHVCDRQREAYPFGSKNLPRKVSCTDCKKEVFVTQLLPPSLFQFQPVLAGEGNRCRACLRKWRTDTGVGITYALLLFFGAFNDVDGDSPAVPLIKPAPAKWTEWIPFTVFTVALAALATWMLWK